MSEAAFGIICLLSGFVIFFLIILIDMWLNRHNPIQSGRIWDDKTLDEYIAYISKRK